jgi:hypothetical protein
MTSKIVDNVFGKCVYSIVVHVSTLILFVTYISSLILQLMLLRMFTAICARFSFLRLSKGTKETRQTLHNADHDYLAPHLTNIEHKLYILF